jgi:hypothetical protein
MNVVSAIRSALSPDASKNIGPRLTDLYDHHAAMRREMRVRDEWLSSISARGAQVAEVDRMVADANKIQASIDAAMAAAFRAGLPEPDLTPEREKLAALQRKHARRVEVMRGTAADHAGDKAALDAANQRLNELNLKTPALIEDALEEMLADYAPVLLGAYEAVRVALNELCVIVAAKNTMADSNKSYKAIRLEPSVLALPLPPFPPFIPEFATDLEKFQWLDAERKRERAETEALVPRVDALLHRLATGAPEA